MICPVRLASDMSALRAVKVGDHAQHDLLPEDREGAGDESREVILRALAKRITWWQAAEMIGIGDRQMRRWRARYEEFGFRGLFDRRRGKPSPKRGPEVYRERDFERNVQHFHEKLRGEHQIELRYSWVKGVLQGAGLMARGRKRKRRPRRPLP